MISDVLSDAVDDIDRYLNNGLYAGDLLVRIRRLRNEMDAMREELDSGGVVKSRSGQLTTPLFETPEPV
jgi:hypothetical protein